MNPVTRKEVFLDAICDGEPCNLEPASREEQVLKKLAESMVGGAGGGVFVINFTEKNEYEGIADKTFQETLEAYLSGRPIVAFAEWSSWSDDADPVEYRHKCRLYPMTYNNDGYEHWLSFGTVVPSDSYSVNSISYCFDYYEPDDRCHIQMTKGFIQSAEN